MSISTIPPRKTHSEPITDEAKVEQVTVYPAVGEDTLLAMVEVCKAMAQDVDDETAVLAKALFPDYEDAVGQTVSEGYKFRYAGELYKTTHETEITEAPGEGTADIYEDLG